MVRQWIVTPSFAGSTPVVRPFYAVVFRIIGVRSCPPSALGYTQGYQSNVPLGAFGTYVQLVSAFALPLSGRTAKAKGYLEN